MYYRVYSLLEDENGNVVHKCPLCSCKTLKLAVSMGRTNGGLFPFGVWKVSSDGSEIRVY